MTLELIPHTEIEEARWDAFIERSPQASLYALYGYATAIRPDWQAMVVKDKEDWLAVMPFCINQKWKYSYVPQPAFAQYWGVYFAPYPEMSTYKNLSWQRRILECVIEQLSHYHLVIQNFSPEIEYPIPFHWAGFKLFTRYTYCLSLEAEASILRSNLESSLRRQINKSERKGIQPVVASDSSAMLQLLALNEQDGKDLVAGNTEATQVLNRIYTYLQRSGRGEILEARDTDGNCCAAAMFARIQNRSYYLFGVFDPKFKDTGSMTRLIWEGICEAKRQNSHFFDFEGSMIKGIEHFFRKFGSNPVPYVQIHKNQLPLLAKWIHALKT